MELSETLRQRIAGYCRRISVAHNLDPEIQRELAGHMEDKILDILSGQEKLTESDALVIAREHFGAPALIKEMLGEVHASEAAVSLWRRLLALIILSKFLYFVYAIISVALVLIIRRYFSGAFPESPPGFDWYPLVAVSGFLLILAIEVHILKRWKRMMAAGLAPWFVHRWVAEMVFLVLLLFSLAPLLITLANGLSFSPAQAHVYGTQGIRPWPFGLLIMITLWIANSMLWLWWCDSTPRRPGVMRQTIAWYSVYIIFEDFTSRFVQKITADAATNTHSFILFKVNGWAYIWSPPGLSLIGLYGILLLVIIAISWVGYLLYEAARHHSAPKQGSDPDLLLR